MKPEKNIKLRWLFVENGNRNSRIDSRHSSELGYTYVRIKWGRIMEVKNVVRWCWLFLPNDVTRYETFCTVSHIDRCLRFHTLCHNPIEVFFAPEFKIILNFFFQANVQNLFCAVRHDAYLWGGHRVWSTRSAVKFSFFWYYNS